MSEKKKDELIVELCKKIKELKIYKEKYENIKKRPSKGYFYDIDKGSYVIIDMNNEY